MTGPFGTTSSQYDLAGRRTRLTWRDGFYADYDYLVTGEVSAIRENGATSGAGVRAVFAYDSLGRRTGLTRGNGSATNYTYDALSRLSSLSHDLAGTAHDVTIALTYNPASQIATRTLSNDLFAWTGHGSGSTSSTVNGLNQLSVSGGTAFGYDSRGNMTSDGARTYAFSSENLLAGITIGSSTASLGYDPAMRLYQGVEAGNATRFLFEGGDLIGEYANSSLINRYVPGPGTDEPMGTASPSGSRSWTYADERGSIVATEGSTIRINSYDEYGKPGATPTGRFGYTGLPRLNNQLHYARARFYDWNTGRFVQPDPIGYGDGMNMYGYVGGDPVNFTDPTGLAKGERIVCTGTRITNGCGGGGIASGASGFSSAWPGGQGPTGADSLADLGISTSGMSNVEIRNLALGVLGLGESLASAGAPKDSVVRLEYNSSGLRSVNMSARGIFLDAAFCLIAVCKYSLFEVYRAVGPNELADIKATGTYRLKPGGAEGKWFYPTIAQAYKVPELFADLGKKNYTVTSGFFTFQELGPPLRAVGEGTFYVVQAKYLPKGPVKIHPYR